MFYESRATNKMKQSLPLQRHRTLCLGRLISSHLSYYASMPSGRTGRTLCSGCARPWHSAKFKTCDDCRRRVSLREGGARQLAAAVGRSSLLTSPSQFSGSPTVPVFSTLVFMCSTCARPCQSSYDTICNRCRQVAIPRTTPSSQVPDVDLSLDLLTF